jgi:hypothetical protein
MNDAAFRRIIGGTPATPLDAGVRETLERFALLRDQGRLSTEDIDSV